MSWINAPPPTCHSAVQCSLLSSNGAEAFEGLCGGTGMRFQVVTFLPAACCMDGQLVTNDLHSSATAFQPVLQRDVGNYVCIGP